MHCDNPTIRKTTVVEVSKEFIKQLQVNVPAAIEKVVVLDRDGNATLFVETGTTLVETDHTKGECAVYEPSAGCVDLVGKVVSRELVPCDDERVISRTKNQVVAEVNSVSFVRFEECSLICISGSCFWVC